MNLHPSDDVTGKANQVHTHVDVIKIPFTTIKNLLLPASPLPPAPPPPHLPTHTSLKKIKRLAEGSAVPRQQKTTKSAKYGNVIQIRSGRAEGGKTMCRRHTPRTEYETLSTDTAVKSIQSKSA